MTLATIRTHIIFLFFLFFTPLVCWGEYRVYQYYVKSRTPIPQDKQAYKVTSTLNPVAYKAYHGGNNSIKLDLIQTWSCKGHTGHRQPLCESPTEKALRE